MGLIRTSTPTPIITPAEARAHLRIDDASEDTLLAGLIATATDYVERETATTIALTSYTLVLDGWTSSTIQLPAPPLASVTSIIYRDAAGTDVTLASNAYVTDSYKRPGRITLLDRPTLSQTPAAVRINFVAGYAADAVPPTIVHAIKMLVGHFYENREAAIDRRIDTVPLAVESLLLKHTFVEAV